MSWSNRMALGGTYEVPIEQQVFPDRTIRPPPTYLTIGCLCGNVTGAIHGHVGPHRVCHCATCKKVTGSTHANVLMVRENIITINTGTRTVYTHRTQTPLSVIETQVHRCRTCGTPLYTQDAAETFPAVLKVFVGCLKSMDYLESHRPDYELRGQERLPWLPRFVRHQSLSDPPSPAEPEASSQEEGAQAAGPSTLGSENQDRPN